MWRFIRDSARTVVKGTPTYYAWVLFLLTLIAVGGWAYSEQLNQGLIVTSMRDPVSWGFYIGNFAFLVGVAAAAVAMVIPAYIYKWGPIYEIVIFGELVAISATLMCMLFVFVDIGRPDRFWHLVPVIGTLAFPGSILAWDILVLTFYFILCLTIATYVVYCWYRRREYKKRFLWPLIIVSIPAAVAIHTVTAFIFNGLGARPYWNVSILAPRFLASALASGPAIIVMLMLVLRRLDKLQFEDRALDKIGEIMAYAMGINLLLLVAELFKDFYTDTAHVVHLQYLFGLGEHHSSTAPYAYISVASSVIAFFLLAIPRLRRRFLVAGCLFAYGSVYIEKGIALIVPGFLPGTLGEHYLYQPTMHEILVSMGIFGIGFLVLTFLLKVTVRIKRGRLHDWGPMSEPVTGALREGAG